jgi:hypothetical protein
MKRDTPQQQTMENDASTVKKARIDVGQLRDES